MRGGVISGTHMDDSLHRSSRNSRNPIPNVNQAINSHKSSTPSSSTKVCILQRNCSTFGFKLSHSHPFIINTVIQDGVAWSSGLKENDMILEINGESVISKEYTDMIDILRSNTQVKLLLKTGISSKMSISTNSLRKMPPLPISQRIPKNNPNLVRPDSMPKIITMAKVKSENPDQKSYTYPSIQQRNEHPVEKKLSNENKKDAEKVDNRGKSTNSSLSTSDADSRSSKSVPSKVTSAIITSSTRPQNGTTVKSNPPKFPGNLPTNKPIPPPKKISPEKIKVQTIPPDGAKSHNPTVAGENSMVSIQQPSYSTLPKKKGGGLLLGRDFDDDNERDEDQDCSSILVDMLSATKAAISKPGLVAILLNYAKENMENLKTMLLYYSCKLYVSLVMKSEYQNDARRMANEIITTFIHEKSPLYVSLNLEIINVAILNLKNNENLESIFDDMMDIILKVLKDIVEDVRGKIKRGILISDDMSSIISSITKTSNADREIGLLHKTMCNIFKSQQDFGSIDTVSAIKTGLATMYQYFHNFYFPPNTGNRARSTDSLANLINLNKVQTISEQFKIGTLCGTYQSPQKQFQSFRKKSKSVSGHFLVDHACQEPEECTICLQLLWGVSPQGVSCTMCKSVFHATCKKKIKTNCPGKSRSSSAHSSTKEEKPAFFGRLTRKSSTNSTRSATVSLCVENVNNVDSTAGSNGTLATDDKLVSPSVDVNTEISKSPSEDQSNRATNIDGFGSLDSTQNKSIETGGTHNDAGSILIQELVQEEWLSDPDLKIEESFDANTEICSVFPNLDAESDKKRLIVLLEFYHKTRYILMNLKRFLYGLVIKWPKSQYTYFKALSLDCIEPFVTLIKSLVLTIEKCITGDNFVGLEIAILDWLSLNNDENLKEWVSLSSNLCCTNSLAAVKQLKQTNLRAVPELTNLLKTKFHKLVMIEELTQIRPLLISLPLIVKNIIKCLGKEETLYSEELIIWRQVSTKMDFLCEYIDRCCIPLVDWINEGFINKRTEKFDIQFKAKDCEKDIRDFCLDFPRTLFHYPIFDFQNAKIVLWCTNSKTNKEADTQTFYFKKGTEVMLIFYKTFIVVLQKENEHYVLKPIKPIKNIFERQTPIIEISDDIIVNKGGVDENTFVLNVISNRPDNALLLRIGFTRSEVVDSWLEYINTKTYSLARSISLFKVNDSVRESMSQFERTQSSVSTRSKTFLDSMDSKAVGLVSPPIADKDEERSMAVSELLKKAEDALNLRSSLSAILNISEDEFLDHLKVINEERVKSKDELVVFLCDFAQLLIQQAHKALAKSCPKVAYSADFDISQLRDVFSKRSAVLGAYEESTKSIDEIMPEVAVKLRCPERSSDESTPESAARLRSFPQLDEIIREVEMNSLPPQISQDIFMPAVNAVETVVGEAESRSYKYVPAESMLPNAAEGDSFSLEEVFSPNPSHLHCAVEDTITVGRARMIRVNRNSSNAVDDE